MKVKEWFKLFFSGAAMGVANSIPGVSGGTIAVILRIYERLVDAVSNLFKKFVKSFLVLLPIALGIVVAMVPCLILFNKAFEFFQFGIVSLFAGLIIGSFPSVSEEVKNVKISARHIIICVIAALIAIALGILSIVMGGKINVTENIENPPVWFFFVLVAIGFIASVSLIVPGISGSMMLVVLGFYYPLTELVKDTVKGVTHIGEGWFWINVLELGCVAIGVIVGFLVMAKLMKFLLTKHHAITFFAIIGFILGSLVALYLNNSIWDYYQIWGGENHLPIWLEIVLGVVLFIGGAIGSYMLIRVSRKHKIIEKDGDTPSNSNENAAE